MAVGDTIVGMQGTGTEADPYQVVTFSDFLSAISVTDSYVKLMNDINLVNDPVYRNGIQGALRFGCQKFYSDNSYTIYGLKVYSSSLPCFNVSDYSATIQNVNFLSCYFNITSDSVVTLSSKAMIFTANAASILNCKFSIVISVYAFNQLTQILQCPTVQDCSFYFKIRIRNRSYLDTGRDNQHFLYSFFNVKNGIDRSYFYIDGFYYGVSGSQTNQNIVMFSHIRNSTVILVNSRFYITPNDIETGDCGTIYMTIDDCYSNVMYVTGSVYATTPAQILFSSGALSVCYTALALETDYNPMVYHGFQQCTQEQIKDQQFLLDCGFLPN